MAQPRFLFVARARARSDSWSRWDAGPRRAQTTELRAASAWVAWRLVGANNRELGRSSHTFIDLIECSQSVARLRQTVMTAASAVSLDPSTGCWYWRLDVDGAPIAAAGRSYQRQRECVYSLEQFRRAAPSAAAIVHTLIDLRDAETVLEELPLPRRTVEGVPRNPDGAVRRSLTLIEDRTPG